jgi:hypothetical protein
MTFLRIDADETVVSRRLSPRPFGCCDG